MSSVSSPGNGLKFVRVAVRVPARAGSLFSYSAPQPLGLERGAIIMVPFASRILPGIVAGIDQVPPNIPTRDLLGLVVDA
ncbi:MAG: hypothetical protein ACOX87_12445, partial [Chloroflexota bacterium]